MVFLPETDIHIDHFRRKGGRLYLLSHFHSDHMYGLDDSRKRPILCSSITKKLLVHFKRIPEDCIQTLDPGEEIEAVPGFRVKAFEANHCPGAVMFLLRNDRRNDLYTGDFRYCKAHEDENELYHEISTLYVDRTFESEDDRYDHPTQEVAVEQVVELVRAHPDKRILIGTYRIGKEKILIGIHRALGCKIAVSAERYELLRIIGMDSCATLDEKETNVQAIHMRFFEQGFRERFPGLGRSTIIILPTGWAADNCDGNGVFHVPYSEHNSSTELRAFIKRVNPRQIVSLHE
ncbi:MAG: MBL fold metallo-hydrolase [Candidatus Ozemobacteraceae bacterium]